MPYASLARMFMKRQELSPNRQAVQSVVLVRGRSGGTDPSAGPRRLGRALAAVHLLPREKENIVLGGVRPRMDSSNSASTAVGRRAEAGVGKMSEGRVEGAGSAELGAVCLTLRLFTSPSLLKVLRRASNTRVLIGGQ